MSKTSNISSLSELRSRREAIKAEQDAARQGFTSSLATAPTKAKAYALEDLALPALGIGLAVYVGYRVFRSGKPQEEELYLDAHGQPQQDVRYHAAAPARGYRPAPSSRKRSFNFSSLIDAGKLLIPAAQAIIGVIQEQQAKK